MHCYVSAQTLCSRKINLISHMHKFMFRRLSATPPQDDVIGIHSGAKSGNACAIPSPVCRPSFLPSNDLLRSPTAPLCSRVCAVAGPNCSHGLPDARRRHRQWDGVCGASAGERRSAAVAPGDPRRGRGGVDWLTSPPLIADLSN